MTDKTNTNNGCCAAAAGWVAAADLILNCVEHWKLARLPEASLPLFADYISDQHESSQYLDMI